MGAHGCLKKRKALALEGGRLSLPVSKSHFAGDPTLTAPFVLIDRQCLKMNEVIISF